MAIKINCIGYKYGHLTILDLRYTKKPHYYTIAKCQCDCGKIIEAHLQNIKSGKQISCGCYAKRQRDNGLVHFIHGQSKHPLHNVWDKMKSRCNNKKNNEYCNYGGRGIKVCDEWNNDFYVFYRWATENGYQKGLTIDRIDNNKGYCPTNCRWATAKEQANNRRSNVLIMYKGKTQNLLKWSEEKNIPYEVLRARIKNYGWTIERALETPVKCKKLFDFVK